MPYIPPHLRPGYVPPPPPPPPVDLTGKVRFPTNVNDFAESNVVQPKDMYDPRSPGARAAKSALKLTQPITLNLAPPARPATRVRNLPSKYRAYVLNQLGESAIDETWVSRSKTRRRKSRPRFRKSKKARTKRRTRRHR